MKRDSESKTGKAAVLDFTEQHSVDDQAAKWVARLDFDKPSKETLQAFRQWVNQSPKHREAFEEYTEVWGRMNLLSQLVSPRELGIKENEESKTIRFGRSWLFNIRPWLAVCSLVIVSVLVFQGFWMQSEEVYSTAIGEQKTFELLDGSSALLNTGSSIEVRYSDKRRMIVLTRGEAYFDVVSNPELPFEVYAGKGLVRAVGTAFSVRLRKNDVQVVVTEGVVEIGAIEPPVDKKDSDRKGVFKSGREQPKVTKNKKHSQITAGNFATYDRYTAKHVTMAELVNIEQQTSWQQGLLIFEDEPLENVVEEIGRYTSIRILIPEDDVRWLRIGGQFKIGDTAAMFQALKVSFNIRADKVSEDLVYLVYNETENK